MGKSLSSAKDTVRERSKGCCEKCGVELTRNAYGKPESNTSRSLHHRQPRSLGGKDSVINMVNLCWECHHIKIHQNEETAILEGWIVADGRFPGAVPFLSHQGWLVPDSEGGLVRLDFEAGRAVVLTLPPAPYKRRKRVATRARDGQRKSRKVRRAS